MDNNDCCSICTEEYNSTNHIKSFLPCEHVLCRSCLLDIFKNDSRCPFCRSQCEINISRTHVISKSLFRQVYDFLKEDHVIVIDQKIQKIRFLNTFISLVGGMIIIYLL